MKLIILALLLLPSQAVAQSIVMSGSNQSIVMSGRGIAQEPIVVVSEKKPTPVVKQVVTEIDHSVDSKGKDKLSSDAPVQKPVLATMSHSEMVALHNKLHGGGSWTWPGDLKRHLETTHGVSTTKNIAVATKQATPVVKRQTPTRSNCPNGVCPNPSYRSSRNRGGLFRIFRR